MHHKEYALIVAGGKGTRMQGTVPKQFLELKGLPILMHTLEVYYRYAANLDVVLVLPHDDFPTWEALCVRHQYTRPVRLCAGGHTRFQSVRAGLDAIGDDGIVAIHDGVRPLVTHEMIATSFILAAKAGSAVAAVPLKESIREITGDRSMAVDRTRYQLIQTPQTFEVGLIKRGYSLPEDPALTDDASVVERLGHAISLFGGSYRNIKITTPEDLRMAEALI